MDVNDLRIRPFKFTSSLIASNITSFSLDANNDGIEFIFRAREAATITQLGLRLTSITGTTPTYKVSLQGVNASGRADGTIKGGGSPASKTFSPSGLSWAANTFNWLTLDNSYACTAGERLAVVVAYDSGTVDGSNFASMSTLMGFTEDRHSLPCAVHIAAGSGTKQTATGWPCFGYASATKSYGYPIQSIETISFDNATTPDEPGCAFTIPAGMGDTYKLSGFGAVFHGGLAGQTLRVRAYEGTTVRQEITGDMDNDDLGVYATRLATFTFTSADYTYACGTEYIVALKATATQATDCQWYNAVFARAQDRTAFEVASWFSYITRTDDGAWGSADTTRVPLVELCLKDFTEPAGGGGGGATLPLFGGCLVRS